MPYRRYGKNTREPSDHLSPYEDRQDRKITERHAARAILLTDRNEVLLMRMDFPWQDEHLWILPGGGIESGESPEQAVEREIFEETGARNLNIGPIVWHREFLVEARATLMKQRYLLVRCERFEPVATALLGAEQDWLQEYRWWTVDELISTRDLNVEPANVGAGIEQLITQGPPPGPFRIDDL